MKWAPPPPAPRSSPNRSRQAWLVRQARRPRTHFTVLIAEGQPDGNGHRTAMELLGAGVPVRMIEFEPWFEHGSSFLVAINENAIIVG